MPGKRANVTTWLTPQEFYRRDLTAIDDYNALDTWISPEARNDDEALPAADRLYTPAIRLDLNKSAYVAGVGRPTGTMGAQVGSDHGYDSVLGLYIKYNGVQTYNTDPIADGALIDIFGWADEVPISDEPINALDHNWFLLSTYRVTCNRQIVLNEITATAYIVLVREIPAEVSIDILEQHTE